MMKLSCHTEFYFTNFTLLVNNSNKTTKSTIKAESLVFKIIDKTNIVLEGKTYILNVV